jgi:hypothetical protein
VSLPANLPIACQCLLEGIGNEGMEAGAKPAFQFPLGGMGDWMAGETVGVKTACQFPIEITGETGTRTPFLFDRRRRAPSPTPIKLVENNYG